MEATRRSGRSGTVRTWTPPPNVETGVETSAAAAQHPEPELGAGRRREPRSAGSRKTLLAAAARRGRCAAAVAAVAADSNRPLNHRQAAAAHRVMPPSALRVLGSAVWQPRAADRLRGRPAQTGSHAPTSPMGSWQPAFPLRRCVASYSIRGFVSRPAFVGRGRGGVPAYGAGCAARGT